MLKRSRVISDHNYAVPAPPLAPPVAQRGHQPEINFSAIHVGGDVGGLIFVVGSVVIVLTGVPDTSCFLLGAAIGGLSVARALVWLHARRRPDAPGHLSVTCR